MATLQSMLEAAFADHQRGNRSRAAKRYRKVLNSQPNNPDALYLFGILCHEEGDGAKAVKNLRRAVAAAAKAGRRVDPAWRLALGTALQRAGDNEAALAEFDAVLRVEPGNIDALFCGGTALQDLARLDEAIATYEAVVGQAPKHAEALNNLGSIYRDQANPSRAVAAFRRAISARPNYADALFNLGTVLADAGRASEAAPALRAAVEAQPDNEDLFLVLFDCLADSGDVEEVEWRAEGYLERHPDAAPIAAALGSALLYLGRKKDAIARFRQALEIDPACARAHQGMVELAEEIGQEAHIKAIRRVLERENLGTAARVGLNFALARHHTANGHYAKCFDAWSVANRLKRSLLERRGYAYDRDAMEQEVDVRRSAYSADRLRSAGAVETARPVFIVGMPRSGTTLTEQVLASHPSIFGAGELGILGQISSGLQQLSGYPVSNISPVEMVKAAETYLRAVGERAGDALRVTDKMPGNFKHLGLIVEMFSDARIVHCRRDPTDTCLSCFAQNFRASALSWACDLEDLGHCYCQYRRMMDHWRAILPPGRMLEVDYEDTVADLESQARRLIDFVGLEWDDSCLRFYETDRVVVTASHSAVRREVYTSSVGRWKRYGDGLRPLIKALSDCGCAPEADRP